MCWNDCFRKIFGYKRHESVRELQFLCGELSFDLRSYDFQRWKFFSGAQLLCDNLVFFINFRCMLYVICRVNLVLLCQSQMREHIRAFLPILCFNVCMFFYRSSSVGPILHCLSFCFSYCIFLFFHSLSALVANKLHIYKDFQIMST